MIRPVGSWKGDKGATEWWAPAALSSRTKQTDLSGGPGVGDLSGGPGVGGLSGGPGVSAPQPQDVEVGGTNNGGLMDNMGWATTAAQGNVRQGLPTGAHGAVGNDPLFYSPASQRLPTSGEAPPSPVQQSRPQQNLPNAYRYPGSEGWVTASGQPTQR